AKAHVQTKMLRQKEDENLPAEERTPEGIRTWLVDAISRGGEALFGQPDIDKPAHAKDQLQSRFVLKLMAYHLSATLGSVFTSEEGDHALPVGALSLAACAVERAFQWYRDDQPNGLPMKAFSRNYAGKCTGKWRDTAVQELIDRSHRFERLLSRARALVTAVAPPPLTSAAEGGPAMNNLYVRERSSSPPTALFYDHEQ
ncbi:hypothetical protein OH76DRAFT_1366582, partial [Lentinus brumalis]